MVILSLYVERQQVVKCPVWMGEGVVGPCQRGKAVICVERCRGTWLEQASYCMPTAPAEITSASHDLLKASPNSSTPPQLPDNYC